MLSDAAAVASASASDALLTSDSGKEKEDGIANLIRAQMLEEPPVEYVVWHHPLEAAAAMRGWAESSKWRESGMENNEWTALPLPVLERVLREDMSLKDLLHAALVCKQWSVAVTTKIHFSAKLIADRSLLAREERVRRQADRHRDALLALRLFCLLCLPAILCLVVGVVGATYFAQFLPSVSTVPECANVHSMRASLFACCGLWLVDAAFFFLFSLAPFPCGVLERLQWHKRGSAVCSALGCFSNLGLAIAAAVCVNSSNSCMDVVPLVAWTVRAYAAVSLALGLLLLLLCLFCLDEST